LRRHTAHTAGPRGALIAAAVAAAGLGMTGCSKEIVVESTFPEPVIDSLPLDAGVNYTEALENYDYVEDLPNDIEWSITLGEANVRMFDAAFGALFRNVVPVEQPGGAGPPFDTLDIVIEPRLEAFEFSLPRQSRSDQYAVWIKYNLAVYEPDGQFITNWPVSAYGQADSQLFRGGGAMKAAVVRAMRDAIANIVIGFPTEPTIQAALFPEDVVTEIAPTEELAAEPSPVDGKPPEDAPAEETPAEEPDMEEGPVEEVQS